MARTRGPGSEVLGDGLNGYPLSSPLRIYVLGQTLQSAAANPGRNTDPLPAFGAERDNLKSVKERHDGHDQKEWACLVAMCPAAASRVRKTRHAHPNERNCPDQGFGWMGHPNGGNQRNDRQPPSQPEAEVVSDPVLGSLCDRFRHRRFSLRAARIARVGSREPCFLYRRTRIRPVGAEHAAITWLRLENGSTALTVV